MLPGDSNVRQAGPAQLRPRGCGAAWARRQPRPGSCDKATIYFMKIPTPFNYTGVRQVHEPWPPGVVGAAQSARCLARLPGQSGTASLGEALGQAGPRDTLHVRRPSVIAQLPHVLGHHVEEQSDKALGADAGHWGQRVASATRQTEPGCSGPVSVLSPGPATAHPRPSEK